MLVSGSGSPARVRYLDGTFRVLSDGEAHREQDEGRGDGKATAGRHGSERVVGAADARRVRLVHVGADHHRRDHGVLATLRCRDGPQRSIGRRCLVPAAARAGSARSAGDLVVTTRVAASPLFERRGSDLVIRHVEAAIPLRGTGAASELMKVTKARLALRIGPWRSPTTGKSGRSAMIE